MPFDAYCLKEKHRSYLARAKNSRQDGMIFGHLLFQPSNEIELMHKVADTIQGAFQEQQKLLYYLKLEDVSPEKSQIIWVKSFKSREEFDDFRWSFKYEQAKLAVFFKLDYYRIALGGFKTVSSADVYTDRIAYSRFVGNRAKNIESHKMVSRELVEAGFADLLGQFRDRAKKPA